MSIFDRESCIYIYVFHSLFSQLKRTYWHTFECNTRYASKHFPPAWYTSRRRCFKSKRLRQKLVQLVVQCDGLIGCMAQVLWRTHKKNMAKHLALADAIVNKYIECKICGRDGSADTLIKFK